MDSKSLSKYTACLVKMQKYLAKPALDGNEVKALKSLRRQAATHLDNITSEDEKARALELRNKLFH